MFGIGMPELVLILVVALIVVGPKKLPDLGKALGRGIKEFRKAASELKDTLDVDADDMKDVKSAFNDMNQVMKQKITFSDVVDTVGAEKSSDKDLKTKDTVNETEGFTRTTGPEMVHLPRKEPGEVQEVAPEPAVVGKEQS